MLPSRDPDVIPTSLLGAVGGSIGFVVFLVVFLGAIGVVQGVLVPFVPEWAVPGATVLGFGVVVTGGLYGFFRVMDRLKTGI